MIRVVVILRRDGCRIKPALPAESFRFGNRLDERVELCFCVRWMSSIFFVESVSA